MPGFLREPEEWLEHMADGKIIERVEVRKPAGQEGCVATKASAKIIPCVQYVLWV